MQHAKRIGNDLSQTFLKLEQLSLSKFCLNYSFEWQYLIWILVAKQSSLFNDKSMEIQDLTLSIKQDIGNLNRQIAQLQQVWMNRFEDMCNTCLVLVYESYKWKQIEKLANTFQFSCFCFTSKTNFESLSKIIHWSSFFSRN